MDNNNENTKNNEEYISNSARRAKISMYSTSNKDSETSASDGSANNDDGSSGMSESLVGAPLKKQYRLEMSKLREMTFREKVEYIWGYYRFHIIAIVIALILSVSIVVAIFSPSTDTVLFVAWSAGFLPEESNEHLVNELESFLIDENRHEKVEVVMLSSAETDPLTAMANSQRLFAMVAAGQIDLFILDAQTLESHSISGFIRPLDDILADVERINPSVARIINVYIVYAGFIEEHTVSDDFEIDPDSISERIMGVRIGDSPIMSDVNFFAQDLYFAVSITSNQIENVIATLIELFEPSP